MHRSLDRILTTHTGSLHGRSTLRSSPQELAGEVYDERRSSAVAQRRAEIVQKQVSVGIDVVDDGEFSKVDLQL